MAVKVRFNVLIMVVLLAVAYAHPDTGYSTPSEPEKPAKYSFNYQVQDDASENDFGHQEARDGPDTQGSYQVQLPDGRLQKVSYTVSVDSGYVADVMYEGEPQYPADATAGYA
ncbi:pro-resilin-like [Penaeus japonicus]|uniref:pro-resilin-like n=1 Tax=Penaeus japonicus TaxID=27405 RepID=UPI001C70F3AF|nr:pro-resilin-like [Penaeus japonicus]